MRKLFTYLKESKAELRKVVWPSRKQTRDNSIVVIIVSLAVALFLGAIDFIIEKYILGLFL